MEKISLTTWRKFCKIIPVADEIAQIAQLVEQRTENPRVAGSIPALGIKVGIFLRIIEFRNGSFLNFLNE